MRPEVLSVLSVEPYGMKRPLHSSRRARLHRLSVLSVEPYGMKQNQMAAWLLILILSVLSVEPYGMKPAYHPD